MSNFYSTQSFIGLTDLLQETFNIKSGTDAFQYAIDKGYIVRGNRNTVKFTDKGRQFVHQAAVDSLAELYQ